MHNCLDWHKQRAKRKFWKLQPEQLMVNINSNQKIFWNDIGKLGMANERQKMDQKLQIVYK